MAIKRKTAPKNGRKQEFELKFEKLNPVAFPKIPSEGKTIPLRIFKS